MTINPFLGSSFGSFWIFCTSARYQFMTSEQHKTLGNAQKKLVVFRLEAFIVLPN